MTPTHAGPATGQERGAALLALGFGSTVAMWAVAYLCRLQPGLVPPWLLFFLVCACFLIGGFLAARLSALGLRGAFGVGALAAVLNLLVLGSLLSGASPGALRPSALLWVPGSLLLGALLAGAGGWLASLSGAGHSIDGDRSWNSIFAGVAAVATLLLLAAGGLVTSKEAGLAVTDWPNSFGYNMFLYPVSRMTGGIFYEHAHRLLGSLVGLTTLALAVQLQRSETRVWLKRLGWLAFVAVILQGILGGLRVTGGFTMSQSPADMAPSLALAVVHGIFGQAFFGLLVAIGVFTASRWVSPPEPLVRETTQSDRELPFVLLGAILLQLTAGALLRHYSWGLWIHIILAVLVLPLAVAVGARNWGLYGERPELSRTGRLLTLLTALQLLLGIGALVAVGTSPEPGNVPAWEVTLATVHQINGALLLGCAVLLACWCRRLLAR